MGLLGFWTAIIARGPWTLATLGLAYAAFAYHWSVLQWVYHLRTPIDVVEGAYNLRVPAPVRRAWLNFNCNLTHHRRPELPWQELHAATDPTQTQPLWYRYLLMWLPPTRFPDDLSSLEKTCV
jgi:fatty acid desaturase